MNEKKYTPAFLQIIPRYLITYLDQSLSLLIKLTVPSIISMKLLISIVKKFSK